MTQKHCEKYRFVMARPLGNTPRLILTFSVVARREALALSNLPYVSRDLTS